MRSCHVLSSRGRFDPFIPSLTQDPPGRILQQPRVLDIPSQDAIPLLGAYLGLLAKSLCVIPLSVAMPHPVLEYIAYGHDASVIIPDGRDRLFLTHVAV